MIVNFSTFNGSIELSPGNWEKELISKLEFNKEYITDIFQDIIDDGSHVNIENKIFNDKFKLLSNKGEFCDTSKEWYQGQIISIKFAEEGRYGFTYRHNMDEIINIMPKLIDLIKRLRLEFDLFIKEFGISTTIVLIDKSKRIKPNEIKFLPSKKSIKKKEKDNMLDPKMISQKIIHLTGGEKSIFKCEVKDGNIVFDPNGFDKNKAKTILRNIISKKYNNSEKISLEDDGQFIIIKLLR